MKDKEHVEIKIQVKVKHRQGQKVKNASNNNNLTCLTNSFTFQSRPFKLEGTLGMQMSVGWLVSISYTAVNHEWMILAQLININQALKMTQGHKVKGQVQMCKFVKILFWLYITNL